MGQNEDYSGGKGMAFLSGLMIGSALGALTIYLLAAPTGKKVLKNLQQESISLKGKGSDFIQTAKQKSIDLTQRISSTKKETLDDKEQMIPIPKDY